MTELHKNNITIREAIPKDIEFIYATWLNSYHYDSWAKSIAKSVFFNNYKRVIDKVLSQSKVAIACLTENQDVILGYLVYDEPKRFAHYVFVKEAFRGFGLASELYKSVFKTYNEYTEITHRTKTVSPIIKLKKSLIYNPFVLYNKE